MLLACAPAFADDGELQIRNVSKTPDWDTEHASLQQLWFYVPAQTSDGETLTIEYVTLVDDADFVTERDYARPLISFYEDGPVVIPEDSGGFYGHGMRDMYAALSLDDGATWKKANLSRSADKSSYTLPEPGIPDPSQPTISLLTDCADGDTFCLTEASWTELDGPNGALDVTGFSPYKRVQIEIVNGVTGDHVTYIRSKANGDIVTTQTRYVPDSQAPCSVQAVYGDDTSNIIAVADAPADCVGPTDVPNMITAYPGDVFRNFTTVAGNKVLAVWASRYCDTGNPTYSMETQEIEDIFASEYVDTSHLGDVDACTDDDADDPQFEPTLCPYFEDYWHVSGAQGVQDFAEEDYPTVGLVPYACMWAARGTLELMDDGVTYGIVWRQAERLSSGVRDVHRMEAACVGGAGCVVTWQEDPEGLRPGKGEGPGEGWSGAIAHHETDIWYSYIDWDNFDLVQDDSGNIMPLSEYTADGRPQAGVPMSIPIRLTDNAMCQLPDAFGNSDDPYCYIDFDQSGIADSCEEGVQYDIETPEGPTQTVYMCVAEDGRLMRGNTASTRTRTNLRGYDSAADAVEGTDSGWVVLAYEESKGLGEEDDEDADKIDMGKNIWYHTFDMFHPELVSQGLILNQPAIYPDEFELGELLGYDIIEEDASTWGIESPEGYFGIIDPDPIYSVVGLESTLYQTEIARRYSQITQPASWAGESGTVALAMYKQGIVRQGGPADVFGRRFIIPDEFNAAEDNPFDYANMDCADGAWQFTDGSNPRYVKGLCMSSPQNMSATTLVDCEDGVDNCEPLDFPYDDLFSDIDKTDQPGGLPKMTEWRQCEEGLSFNVTSSGDVTQYTCDDTDIDDQSWENPWDLSKGHRGFMYGDFIMMMYAWSPNWEANIEAHDNYNLYARRSFDGGASWTTLPSSFSLPDGVVVPDDVIADGTMTCEWYGVPGTDTEYPACFTYGAGEFEQARNLSQLIGTHDTVLDPRFTGTDPSFLGDITKMMVDGVLVDMGTVLYPDDVVDPSKFFATFEEGDTADIADGGEGMPMDMFYARATNFGDDYDLADENGDGVADVDPTDGEFEIFDKLEWHEAHAAEAALRSNPGATLFYAIWNEWMETEDGDIYDSDAIVRRTMELGDDGVTTPTGGDGGL
jgi:hypothetical protein